MNERISYRGNNPQNSYIYRIWKLPIKFLCDLSEARFVPWNSQLQPKVSVYTIVASREMLNSFVLFCGHVKNVQTKSQIHCLDSSLPRRIKSGEAKWNISAITFGRIMFTTHQCSIVESRPTAFSRFADSRSAYIILHVNWTQLTPRGSTSSSQSQSPCFSSRFYFATLNALNTSEIDKRETGVETASLVTATDKASPSSISP